MVCHARGTQEKIVERFRGEREIGMKPGRRNCRTQKD